MLPASSESFTLFCFFMICTLKYSDYLHFSVFCNYYNQHMFVQCRANVCYKISLYKSQNSKGVANEFLRVKPLYYLKKIDFVLTRKGLEMKSMTSIVAVYGPGSSVCIVTDYGLDGPGKNPGGDQILFPSRLALGPTHPRVKWVPSISRGQTSAGACCWPLIPF